MSAIPCVVLCSHSQNTSCGAPMENTHNTNRGRPKNSLIPKINPCEKQDHCGSPPVSLFLHVCVFKAKKLEKDWDSMTFYNVCFCVSLAFWLSLLAYDPAYCPDRPIFIKPKIICSLNYNVCTSLMHFGSLITMQDLKNKAEWLIEREGREYDSSTSVKSCKLTSCVRNPSSIWHLVVSCGLPLKLLLQHANAVQMQMDEKVLWVILCKKVDFCSDLHFLWITTHQLDICFH